MFFNKLPILAGIALAMTSLTAGKAQAAAIDLQPSSKWELDYADDSCALRRMFGEGDKRAQIEIRKFRPGDNIQIVIASNIAKTRKVPFRFRFVPADDWSKDSGRLFLTLGKEFNGAIAFDSLVDWDDDLDIARDRMTPAEYLAKHNSSELEAAAKVTGFEVDKLFGKSILLETGSLKAPLLAMNACLDELVTHWGIDVEAQKMLTRGPRPVDIEKASRMVGYPPKMQVKGMPGLVNIRLDIDRLGGVTACHIQMPLSDPEFEKSSCADIQHALDFEPALDKDGNPVASYWTTRVIFSIN